MRSLSYALGQDENRFYFTYYWEKFEIPGIYSQRPKVIPQKYFLIDFNAF